VIWPDGEEGPWQAVDADRWALIGRESGLEAWVPAVEGD
jgi:hypothetical protein